MSTRCQIEFVLKHGKRTERTLVYRHSDGYPESIIPDLVKFLKWNKGRNIDLEYLVANWIYYEKKQFEQYIKDKDYVNRIVVTPENIDTIDNSEMLKLGYGVCQPKTLHGDIEYFYRVTISLVSIGFENNTKITIEVYDTDFDLDYKALVHLKPHIFELDTDLNPINLNKEQKAILQ